MSRLFRTLSVAIILAATAFAQSGNQGSISGTTTDSSGAVIGGASVMATNQDTATGFTTVSTSEGLFNFPVVPVGSYELRVTSTRGSRLTNAGVRNAFRR
jgi:hypothetical protein